MELNGQDRDDRDRGDDRRRQDNEDADEDDAANARDFARILRGLNILMGQPRPGADGNDGLVEDLKRQDTIKSEIVEEAFKAIPREYFVTEDMRDLAYIDSPQRFSRMSFNISAPHMHACVIEQLEIEPGNSILDIGSGSGHLTALFAYITGTAGLVHGLDLFNYIVDFGRENLKKFLEEHEDVAQKLAQVEFIQRNVFVPVYPFVTYDRIHVGACCPKSYFEHLYKLLKPGGIMVTPYGEELIQCKKPANGEEVVTCVLAGVRYGDLILPSDAEIKLAEKQNEIAKAYDVSVPQSTFRSQLSSLCFSEKFSDVAFCVDGTTISAHSLFISLRSPVLSVLVEDAIKKKKDNEVPTVPIEGCSLENFRAILNWIYSDSVRFSTDQKGLLKSAEAFGLTDLVDLLNGKALEYSLEDKLSALVDTAAHSDIEFILDSQKIPAHSLILLLRSEHFRRVLSWKNKETALKQVKLTDISKDELLMILRYLYTDKVDLDPENSVTALENANFFQLDRLKALCEGFWREHISVENASDILSVAEYYNASQLLAFTQQFIFSHIEDVVETDSFKGLDQTVVSNLLIASVNFAK